MWLKFEFASMSQNQVAMSHLHDWSGYVVTTVRVILLVVMLVAVTLQLVCLLDAALARLFLAHSSAGGNFCYKAMLCSSVLLRPKILHKLLGPG